MTLFAKIVNHLKLLTIFAKSSILDTWWGSDFAPDVAADDLQPTENVIPPLICKHYIR